MISADFGGGIRRLSTPWITPFVPNWPCELTRNRGSQDTYNVNGHNTAVEVHGQAFETDFSPQPLWSNAKRIN